MACDLADVHKPTEPAFAEMQISEQLDLSKPSTPARYEDTKLAC